MAGEIDLQKLIAGMEPVLDPKTYVFAKIDAQGSELEPLAIGVFREDEGITLILEQTIAAQEGVQHEFPCRRITLAIHSALDAVGFMAAVASELSRHGISTNPVSAFHHDHLFVPKGKETRAMEVLKALARRQVD